MPAAPRAAGTSNQGTGPGPQTSAREVALQAECERLQQRLAAIPRGVENASNRISELERALLSIRQARDSLSAQVHTLTNRMQAAESRVEELMIEHESMECSGEFALATVEAGKREIEQLKGLLETKEQVHRAAVAELESRLQEAQSQGQANEEEQRSAQLVMMRKKLARAEEKLSQSEERYQQTLAEKSAQDQERRGAEGVTTELRRQVEQQAAERAAERKEFEVREQQQAAEMAELEARLAKAEANRVTGEQLAELASTKRKLAMMDEYFDKLQAQQKQSNAALVDRCVQANRARRSAEEKAKRTEQELQEIGAKEAMMEAERDEARAEVARLQAHLAQREAQPAQTEAEAEAADASHRQQVAELTAELDAARDELRLAWSMQAGGATAQEEKPEPTADFSVAEPILAPLEGSEAQEALDKMGAILEVAATATAPDEALELLQTTLQDFAQRTLCAGSMATYRMVSVCGEIVQWLRKSPLKIVLMEGLLHGSFQTLRRLATNGGAEADTAEASIYVVDDDVDNCECIAMALDKIGLRPRYASNPELAVEHLVANPYDLIILDVDLGTANGFEVHSRLREVPHFRHTPILFLSALSSAEDEVEQLDQHHNGFLAKPYTLHGLGLKVLDMLVNARLPA